VLTAPSLGGSAIEQDSWVDSPILYGLSAIQASLRAKIGLATVSVADVMGEWGHRLLDPFEGARY
jgi:hypothetical protein